MKRHRIISMILALLLFVSLTPLASAESAGFSDVPLDHWAREAIETCASLGIVTGYEGKFAPEDNVTGIQFITMVTRTFYGAELEQTAVPAGAAWYYRNVAVAEEHGLTGGGVELSGSPMNRYDMARVLYSVLLNHNKLVNVNDAAYLETESGIPTTPGSRRIVCLRCGSATRWASSRGLTAGTSAARAA